MQGASDSLQGQPLHALFQLSGAIRTLAKVPLKELSSMDNASLAPPSVYNAEPMMEEGGDGEYPSICETLDDQSDTQLALAAPHLVRAAEICLAEIEVQTNIVRTLSVLSEQDKCCEQLVELAPRLGILLGPCPNKMNFLERANEVTGKPFGMLSRIGYILGNIMAKSDAARMQVSGISPHCLFSC